MAAYCRVYDSRHLQADCQELGSAAEPCAQQSSMGYLYLFKANFVLFMQICPEIIVIKEIYSGLSPIRSPIRPTKVVAATNFFDH